MTYYNTELDGIGRTYDNMKADESYLKTPSTVNLPDDGYLHDWKGDEIRKDDWVMVVYFKKSKTYVIPHKEYSFEQYLEQFITKEENFFDLIDGVDPYRDLYWNLEFIKGSDVREYLV